MQEARDEVLAIYHAYALDKSESWDESEDHLAVELEFMQVMCLRSADALDAGDEDRAESLLQVQRGFLDEHLNAWYPLMAADIARLSKTDFYQGAGKLCRGFLDEDSAFLADILEDEAQE